MWREVVAAAILAGLTAGCGLPSDEAPRVLPSAEVPFELLSDRQNPSVPSAGTRTSRLFLVRGDRLAVTVRRSPTAFTPLDVVRALVAGPIGEEPDKGLRTAVPTATRVLGVEVSDGIAAVDLSTEFTSVGSEQQILALAQVVHSLAEIPEIDAVRFLIEGEPVQVPRGDGALTAAALTPADYAAVTGR